MLKERTITHSRYPFAHLSAPDSEGRPRSSFVIPTKEGVTYKEALQLCVNAQRYIPGTAYIARQEEGGVRIWRTM